MAELQTSPWIAREGMKILARNLSFGGQRVRYYGTPPLVDPTQTPLFSWDENGVIESDDDDWDD